MKQIILLIGILVCNLLPTSVYGQSSLNRLDTIDNMTIKQVKSYLEKNLETLDQIITLSNFEFKLAPAIVTSDMAEPNSKTEYYPIYSADTIQKTLYKYLNSLKFKQYRGYPKSEIELPIYSEDLSKTLPQYTFSEYYAVVKKLFLFDGKSVEVNDTIDYLKSAKYKITKVVDSIEVKICFYYPKDIKRIELSATNNEYKDGDNTIRLTEMNDKNASFIMEGNIINRILSVEATSLTGNVVKNTTATSFTFDNITPFEQAENIRPLLADIVSRISNDELTRTEDVKKALSIIITKYEDKLLPKALQKNNYGYKADIKNIMLTTYSGLDSVVMTMTIPNKDIEYLSTNYAVVYSDANGKAGLMDKEGNWIVQPKYNSLEHSTGVYYSVYNDSSMKKNYYRLDKQKRKLVSVDFDILLKSYDNNRLFLVSSADGKKGVIDSEGNYILAMEYLDIVYFPETSFFATRISLFDSHTGLYNEGGGLYDLNGTQVLSDEYYIQNVQNGFIYGYFKVLNKPNKEFILNKNKQQILKDDRWWAYRGYFSEGLCLINDQQDQHTFYIDTIGSIIIPPNKELEYISPIINELAVFKKMGSRKMFGYIDNKGNQIISPIYTFAEPFFTNVAYVEIGEEAFFIDKENQIVSRLKSKKRNRYLTPASQSVDEIRFRLDNGEVYDAYGKLVSDDE